MGNFPCQKVILIITLAILLVFQTISSSSSLSPQFYKKSCPGLFYAVRCAVQDAIREEARMGASLLRLHFHDCFVNGCDASILLDDNVTTSIKGEKTAGANLNSARGFDQIDTIKSAVEKVCPKTVSCADILAIVARDSVVLLGGPSWEVKLGRKDSLNARLADANNGSIPAPTLSLSNLAARFNQLGLSKTDLVALSGAHTIGQAKCSSFRNRIYNDANINKNFATKRRAKCPKDTGNNNTLAPLDISTPKQFDNEYYKNLVGQKGLLHSDQELFSGGSTDSIVREYSSDQGAFYDDFAKAMIKMGDIKGSSSSRGEIRTNCRMIN